MPRRVEFRRDEKGRLTRRCNGPHHEGAWVSVDQFRRRHEPNKDGTRQYQPWCRRCNSSIRNGSDPVFSGRHTVDDRIKHYIDELDKRLGREEASRRVGVGRTTWRNLVNGKRTFILSKTLAKLVLAYAVVVKRENVRRTRREIKWNDDLREERRKARLTSQAAPGKT